MQSICVVCGVVFEKNNGKQVCCSSKCNVAKWRNKNPVKSGEINVRAKNKRVKHRRSVSVDLVKLTNNADNEKFGRVYHRRDRIDKQVDILKLSAGCSQCGYKVTAGKLELVTPTTCSHVFIGRIRSVHGLVHLFSTVEVICSDCFELRHIILNKKIQGEW